MTPRDRFESLFAAHHGAVRAYALRRAAPHLAQDAVAETFTVAWRRLDDVPDDPLPWLLGVTRRTLANLRRGEARAGALAERVAHHEPATTTDPAEAVDDAAAIRAALATLSESDRETLMLVAWDGLEPADAAQVVGCTKTTFNVRLHRARRRLAAALDAAHATPAPTLLEAR